MLREFDADTDTSEANYLPQAGAKDSAVGIASDPDHQKAAPGHESCSPRPEADLEPAAKNGFGAVFQNRNFLILWAGQLFSQLADKVYLVLMIAIIAARFETPGQTISGWVAAVMIAFTIPAVLFGAMAGVFVDRWPKRPVLVWSNLLRGGLVIALPLGIWLTAGWGSVLGLPVAFWLLLVVTFLISTLTQFFARPSSRLFR
jgi:hypothetical protein